MQTKRVELQYIKEFDSYGVPKSVLFDLNKEKVLADIRLPENVLKEDKNKPLLGFLLGQDMSKDGTDYYTISPSYLESMKNTGSNIRFLDYDNPVAESQNCHGIVLPGGCFDCPEDYFIINKNLGEGIGKRFLAYKNIIENASKEHKPMLGICAGAQMLGSVLGKVKMYLHINKEVPSSIKHKPTEKGEVCLHKLKFFEKTPIYEILGISPKDEVQMNSRHEQAMVLNTFKQENAPVEMSVYAVSEGDNIPEIWGNDKEGILCVQGHPEDFAASGDKVMQNIYNYVAKRAMLYMQQHK